jgi:hypothetical protein
MAPVSLRIGRNIAGRDPFFGECVPGNAACDCALRACAQAENSLVIHWKWSPLMRWVAQWRCHRPHPGKETKKYQVEEVREFLQRVGIEP